MQGHDRDLLARRVAVIVHDQRDVFEEALQVVEAFQRLDQFLQVLQSPRRLGCLVLLPHGRVAAFVQNGLGQPDVAFLGFSAASCQRSIAIAQGAHRRAQLGRQHPLRRQPARGLDQRNPLLAGKALDVLHPLLAQAPLGQVRHPLEGQIVLGRHRQPEVRHRIADFGRS